MPSTMAVAVAVPVSTTRTVSSSSSRTMTSTRAFRTSGGIVAGAVGISARLGRAALQPAQWGCRPPAFQPCLSARLAPRLRQGRRRADVSQGAAPKGDSSEDLSTEVIVGGIATLLAAVIITTTTVFWDDILDYVYGDFMFQSGLLTPGGIAGAVLWSAGLFYATPYQLLLLFLGKIETERPSDWVYKKIGSAVGQDVDALDYRAPAAVTAAVLVIFVAAGTGVVAGFDLLFEDSTWGVSTGIGLCMSALVYELGRPTRLSPEQRTKLDEQWQTFAVWADGRLEREGRCHFSEVEKAFRSEFAAYRSKEELSDKDIRNMIGNWHPNAERTSSNYYKNLSIRPRIDPFVGRSADETTG